MAIYTDQDVFDSQPSKKGKKLFADDDVFGPPKRTSSGIGQDVLATAAKGITGAGESILGLANIPTLGQAGKAADLIGLNEVYDSPQEAEAARAEHYRNIAAGKRNEFLDASPYSEEQQAAQKRVSDADGVLGKLEAAVRNPSTIATAVGESLPSMFMGGMFGRALSAGTKLSPIAGAAIGEGAIGAGSSAEQIRKESPEGVITPQQAGMSAASGVGTGIFGYIGGRIANKLGFEDADTLIANGFQRVAKQAGKEGAEKSFAQSAAEVAGRIVGGGISEGMFEELPQSLQEQMWQNAATGRPLTEGMDEAAVMGFLSGAAMGGGMNMMPRANAPTVQPPPPVEQPPADPIQQDIERAFRGPLSRAMGTAPAFSPMPEDNLQGEWNKQAEAAQQYNQARNVYGSAESRRSAMAVAPGMLAPEADHQKWINENSLERNQGMNAPVTPETSLLARGEMTDAQRRIEEEFEYQRLFEQTLKMQDNQEKNALMDRLVSEYQNSGLGWIHTDTRIAGKENQWTMRPSEDVYSPFSPELAANKGIGLQLPPPPWMHSQTTPTDEEMSQWLQQRRAALEYAQEANKKQGLEKKAKVTQRESVPLDQVKNLQMERDVALYQNEGRGWLHTENVGDQSGPVQRATEGVRSDERTGQAGVVAEAGAGTAAAPAEVLPRDIGATRPAEITGDTERYLQDQKDRRSFYGVSNKSVTPSADTQGFIRDQQGRKGFAGSSNEYATPNDDTGGFIRDQQLRREGIGTVKEPVRRQPGESTRDFLKRRKEENAPDNVLAGNSIIDKFYEEPRIIGSWHPLLVTFGGRAVGILANKKRVLRTKESPLHIKKLVYGEPFKGAGYSQWMALHFTATRKDGLRRNISTDPLTYEEAKRFSSKFGKTPEELVGVQANPQPAAQPQTIQGATDAGRSGVGDGGRGVVRGGEADAGVKAKFKSKEHAEQIRQIANDQIATHKANGSQPPQHLINKVADAGEYLSTGNVSEGVAGEQVFGHPEATNIYPGKYGNLIPIRASSKEGVESRIDKAQELFDEIARDTAKVRYAASNGDKKAKAEMKTSRFSEKETIEELLRNETMPALNRLLKAVEIVPITPTSPERGQKSGENGQVEAAQTTPKTNLKSDPPQKESAETVPAPSQGEASNPTEAELEDVGLFRKWGDKWQYKFSLDQSRFFTANAKADAIERATKAWNKANPEQRLTRQQRFDKADQDWFADMDSKYGKLSIKQIEDLITEQGEKAASNQKSANREFNGNGGRRTGPAVSAEAVRDFSEMKRSLERYLAKRNESKPTTEESLGVQSQTSTQGENNGEEEGKGRQGLLGTVNVNGKKYRHTGKTTSVQGQKVGVWEYEYKGDWKPVRNIQARKEADSALVTKGQAKLSQAQSTTTAPSDPRAEVSAKLGRFRTLQLMRKGVLNIVGSQEEAKRIIGEARAKLSAAWHGSPHDFDKFKTSAIGTGEGVQAYGYGLYFASSKDVANHYRKRLSTDYITNGKPIKTGEIFERLLAAAKNVGGHSDHTRGAASNIFDMFLEGGIRAKTLAKRIDIPSGKVGDLYKAVIDELIKIDPRPMKGRLYQVELAPQEDEYLLWDKPLGEQSEKVKKALETYGYDRSESSGQEIYRNIAGGSIKGDNAKYASQDLHSLGIRGIKYLDGTSRGKGEGAHNYVIFDENDVEIQAKYSKDGAIQGFTLNGKTYLVPDGIQSGEAWNVFLHEVSHLTRLGFNQKQFNEILNTIKRHQGTSSALGKNLAEAAKRIPSDTPEAHKAEELLAYLIENDKTDVGIVRRFIAMVKAALVKLGISPSIFKPEDFKALAVNAAKWQGNVAAGEGVMRSVRDMFKPVDPNSPALKRFLGNSQITEPVYHGSPETFYTFDKGKLGKNTASPGTGLGFFFAMDRLESQRYAGVGGDNRSFYVKIENPKRMKASALPRFRDAEEAKAYAKRQQLAGYDGIILEDEGHVIVFEPNQVKSAELNTGDFDQNNMDVRYSVAKPVMEKHNVTSSPVKGMKYSGIYGSKATLDNLSPGMPVDLIREPNNDADENAVKIQVNGVDFGYVSRGIAKNLAKRMDDGEDMRGVVAFVSGRGENTKASIVFGAQADLEGYKAAMRWDEQGEAERLQEEERILGKEYADAVKGVLDGGVSAAAEADLFNAMGKRLDLVDTADASTGTKAWDWLKSLPKAVARRSLGAMTLMQLREVYAGKIPEMGTFFQSARDIAADSTKIMSKAQDVYDRWVKLDKRMSKAMSEVMIRATVSGVNPDVESFESKSNVMRLRMAMNKNLNRIAEIRKNGSLAPEQTEELNTLEIKVKQQAGRIENEVKRRKEFSALKAMYDGLSDDAKAVYQDVKKMYTDNLNDLFEALKDRISRQVKDPAQRKATVDMIREKYDKYINEGPYFPLSRFGDYIAIAEKAGGQREVRTFDSLAERTRYTRERRAQGWKVQEKTAKEYSRETQGASGSFFTGVVNAIEENNGLSAGEKKSLIDEVNQHFIKALPDLSHRKHFAHRRKVEGYNRDQMRAFADNMQHAAHHISRIRHADKMTTAVESILERSKMLEGDANADDMTDLHNELVKRLEIMNNPNISPVAQAVTSMGFLMNIGPSIASAVTNMSQTPLVAFPVMSTWFKKQGAMGAFSALKKASADYFTSKPRLATGPSLIDNKKLPQHERDAIAALIDDGTIETSMAMSIAQAAGEDFLNLARTKHGNSALKVMRLASYPFHVAELANRKITALAAYRMAVAEMQANKIVIDTESFNNKNPPTWFMEAVNTAREIVTQSHFDYSRYNRARFMEGNVQRVLFLFKQYSQQMTWLLGRSFYNAAKGETQEVKDAARKRLGMMLAGHFMVAGAMGMPVIGGMMSVLSMLGGDDDEPFDAEVSLRNWLADTVGKPAGEALMRGPWRLLPGLGQIDIANRVSLGDLWFRAPDREAEGKDKFNQYVNLVLGPVASNTANVFMGVNAMAQGEEWRGIEMMMPKAVKDGMKMVRYAREGVKNWKNDTLIDDMRAVELFGQALGFTPSRISEMYEGANAVKNRESVLTNRRESLINRWVQATRRRDADEAREAMDAIVRFNSKNQAFMIRGDSLRKSLRNRMKAQANTKQGVYLPATRNELREYGRFAQTE